jgi:hypothetical protein
VQVLRLAHHLDHVRHFRLGLDFVGHRAQARDHFRVFEFVQGGAAGGQLHARLQLGVDAAIVDDFDQPLSDDALGEIAGQVGEFYQEMEAADIPAGSTRALRLFS